METLLSSLPSTSSYQFMGVVALTLRLRNTYIKHSAIVPDLFTIHAISGCNSVAATYSIDKTTALTVVSEGYRLDLLVDVVAKMIQVTEQAKEFMGACYDIKKCSSMTECKQHVWSQKTD